MDYNYILNCLKEWAYHAKDAATWLWLCLCIGVYGAVITLVKKFITDNVGSLKVSDLRMRYAQFQLRRVERRQAKAAAIVVQPVIVEQEQPRRYFVEHWADQQRQRQRDQRMGRLALKVLCYMIAAVIVARLLSISGNKDTKSQNEALALIILLMLAVFVGSGMLDKIIERVKEQALLEDEKKLMN